MFQQANIEALKLIISLMHYIILTSFSFISCIYDITLNCIA